MWNGRRITDRRQRLKMSQEELADLAGTNQKQISRYERGENVPSAEMLISLARALETTADFLLGLTDDPSRPLRAASDLNPDEIQLVEIYRQKTPENRARMLEVARVL